MSTCAILPAAGLASRMRGLPKFMLPCSDDYETLLERHVINLLPLVDKIWIPTRPEYANLILRLGFDAKVIIQVMETRNMSETVIEVASAAKADNFVLCMPDTYFYGDLPYETLSKSKEILHLSLFKIRNDQKGKLGQILLSNQGTVIDSIDKDENCDYELAWGAMSFSNDFVKLLNPDEPHVGYAIPRCIDKFRVKGTVLNSEYFDCGTPSEYLKLLKTIWT